MADYLDILRGNREMYYRGEFYKRCPLPQNTYTSLSGAEDEVQPHPMSYRYMSQRETSYRTMTQNLVNADSVSATIRTRDELPFLVGGYIRLQSGELCKILSVSQDMSENKPGAQYLPVPVGVATILQLIQVNDLTKV